MNKKDIFYETHQGGVRYVIPLRMAGSIKRYIDDHRAPGDFLSAVICNDLKEAFQRADDENIKNIVAYVAYFYWEAPSACWGSEEKMMRWLGEPHQCFNIAYFSPRNK